jgi:hypothetical protein
MEIKPYDIPRLFESVTMSRDLDIKIDMDHTRLYVFFFGKTVGLGRKCYPRLKHFPTDSRLARTANVLGEAYKTTERHERDSLRNGE